MTRGYPTARTRAWQVQQPISEGGDVFPPFRDESHPSDRAFNTLSTILQAALVTAQAENSKTVIFLHSAFTWFKDCYEWNQEAQQARAALQQQVRAKQDEFEALNSELKQLRDRIALFHQFQPQQSHRNIREVELKLDGDIDHYLSVIVSLQAKVARREESLVHLRSTLALRTQELVQTKNDLEQTMEIATTQNGSAYSAARPSDAVARTKASHSAGRAACLEVNAATLPASVGYVCGFPPHLAYGLAAQLSGLPLHGVYLMASAHVSTGGSIFAGA